MPGLSVLTAPSLSAVCHTQFPPLSASLLAYLQAGPVPGRPPSLPGPIHESHLCWVPQTPLSPPQTNGVLSKTLGHCTQGLIYSLTGVAASGVGSQAREPSVCYTTLVQALKWAWALNNHTNSTKPTAHGPGDQARPLHSPGDQDRPFHAQVTRLDLSTAWVTRLDLSMPR